MSPETNFKKDFMDIDEASKYLGLSKHWFYKMCHLKKIRYYRLGRKNYFRKDDLNEAVFSGEIKPELKTSENP